MVRLILAIALGYAAAAISIVTSFSLAYLALGPSFAFKAGSTHVSAGWILLTIPLNLAAALIGGIVAAWVGNGHDGRPVKFLAGKVLLLGIALAVVRAFIERSAPPDGLELSTLQAARHAIQPLWYEFALPFLGSAGVLLGGRLGRRRVRATPARA